MTVQAWSAVTLPVAAVAWIGLAAKRRPALNAVLVTGSGLLIASIVFCVTVYAATLLSARAGEALATGLLGAAVVAGLAALGVRKFRSVVRLSGVAMLGLFAAGAAMDLVPEGEGGALVAGFFAALGLFVVLLSCIGVLEARIGAPLCLGKTCGLSTAYPELTGPVRACLLLLAFAPGSVALLAEEQVLEDSGHLGTWGFVAAVAVSFVVATALYRGFVGVFSGRPQEAYPASDAGLDRRLARVYRCVLIAAVLVGLVPGLFDR